MNNTLSRDQRFALNASIAGDHRVQEIVRQRKRGSIPVYLDAPTLRDMGYALPDGWTWASGGGRVQAGLFHTHSAGSPFKAIATTLARLAFGLRFWKNRRGA